MNLLIEPKFISMIDTNFFKFKDNFSKTEHVTSFQLIKSKLTFMPKVTIAIPTYKRSEVLKESLESAIKQTNYTNYEILVIDNNPERNCDTEKLMNLINEPRLSYYKNSENIGMVGNLNRLYTMARGEYVVELHDDDMLYPDFLSTLMSFIENNNEKYDAIYPDRITYNMNDSIKIPERNLSNKLHIFNIKLFDFLWGNIVPSPEHIIKKESFVKIGGYSEDFYPADDLHFYVKFAYYFKTCKLSGYPLSIYRICQNSSAETNTLLGFVIKGTEIQKGILELYKFGFLKNIWKRYNSVYNYKLLNSGKDIYHNKEINVNNEFHNLGFRNYKIDNFLYRIMNYYNRISGICRTKKIKLSNINNHM